MNPIVKSFLSVSAAYLLGESRDSSAHRARLERLDRDHWPARSRQAYDQGVGLARRTRVASGSTWSGGPSL